MNRMKNQKQQKLYGLLVTITVALLLGTQLLLQYTFKTASQELTAVEHELSGLRKTTEARSALVSIYRSLERSVYNPNTPERVNPDSALTLYTAVEKVLKDNQLEHTNQSSSSGVSPGGTLTLQISFTGPYYGVVKALATLRESEYVMRISSFVLSADPNKEGLISGTMTILSTAKS